MKLTINLLMVLVLALGPRYYAGSVLGLPQQIDGVPGDMGRASRKSMLFHVQSDQKSEDKSGSQSPASGQLDPNSLDAGEGDPEVSAGFDYVFNIAADAQGNLYLASIRDNMVMMLDRQGKLMRIAGTGTFGYGGDNGPATDARLAQPQGLAVDSAGDLYIADSRNYRIRKVSKGVITTVAGNGQPEKPQAHLIPKLFFRDNCRATEGHIAPSDVAVDSEGNLYVTEMERHRIRKISKGVITTVAGNGTPGRGGDNGPATKAQLWNPKGIAVDNAGNLYITERLRVRKISNGMITTVAGSDGRQGCSGDNGPAANALFGQIEDIAADSVGNLYIADPMCGRIRKISADVIAIAAGTGIAGYGGDNGPAINARLRSLAGIAVDSAGNLYIADHGNSRIRRVSNGVITTLIRFSRKNDASNGGLR
jgi:trimeric autotransporter adhesin